MSHLINSLVEALATKLELPAETTDDALWASFAEFALLDSRLAGALVSARDKGPVDLELIRSVRRELESRRQWREFWPERVALLLEACQALEERRAL